MYKSPFLHFCKSGVWKVESGISIDKDVIPNKRSAWRNPLRQQSLCSIKGIRSRTATLLALRAISP